MSADLVPLDADRLPAALEADAESARRFAQAARSDATLRAYRSDWADFAVWCDSRSCAAMPATPETVSLYIASRAQAGPDDERGRPTAPLKVATLERRMAAISQAHKLAGVESPALRSREPLHSVWAGVTRTLGTAREKVAPALAADVVAMAAVCDEAVDWRRCSPTTRRQVRRSGRGATRRCCFVGFAAALRRSELAAVRTEHLSFTPDGLRLLIPKSKSDQQGAGQVVGVAYGSRAETCPVRAVRSYVAAAGRELADQGRPSPLRGRCSVRGPVGAAGAQSDCRTDSSQRRQGLCPSGRARLDALRWTLAEAGFATTAARAGKPDRAIQKQTRHRSAAMLAEYVREGRLFDDNASEGIGL